VTSRETIPYFGKGILSLSAEILLLFEPEVKGVKSYGYLRPYTTRAKFTENAAGHPGLRLP
jgi:hypothetical protein